MCGITGYIQRAPASGDLIARMVGRMAHRGPDGAGAWQGVCNGWYVALGHCRLAIIDPAHGHQPMGNEDGSVHITFNGEVYEHDRMRRRLAARGHRFRTTSDTEAVLHELDAALDDPSERLRTLDGMFALAVWNHSLGRLVLARDRVGIKPLYYAPLPDGGLAFASELTALLEHPGIRAEVDADALASYLFMDYCMAPGSLMRGVHKLPPACFLTWEHGKRSGPSAYWTCGESRVTVLGDWPEQVEHLKELTADSVRSRMIADVPIGLFLSGGLDSSLVGALAVEHVARPLKTFSVRLDDPDFDQSGYARLMAAHIGSEHIEESITARSLLETLDEALDCLDEPLADPSLLPTFALSRLAAEHVKVVLSGDGADELWGGYPTITAHVFAPGYLALPQVFRKGLVEPLVRRMPVRHGYQSLEWKAKRFVLRWDDQPLTRHLRWMSCLDLCRLGQAMSTAPMLPRTFEPWSIMNPSGDTLNDILRLDFGTYLPGAVLAKVDRASMAHGLEVRPPLLSNDLIDFAFSLSSSAKVRGRQTKVLLRAAAGGYLPKKILFRPKMGFPVPMARWLRGPLSERLNAALQPGPLWDMGLLERSSFVLWRDQHRAGNDDHSRPLWAIVVLDHWVRRVLKRSSPQTDHLLETLPLGNDPDMIGTSASTASPYHRGV